jgi:methylphosphotriester-DNA--protein-cysteine methyltransferase
VVHNNFYDKHKFEKVSDDIAGTECLHERLGMICNWLNVTFANVKVESPVPMVTSLLQRSDETSVNEIADHVGRSQQHISRLFNKYVGINPKKLQRIFRFQKVLQTICTQPDHLLTSTAYQYNYFDQPHFNNEIRAFSGFTPAQLMRQNVLDSFRVIR